MIDFDIFTTDDARRFLNRILGTDDSALDEMLSRGRFDCRKVYSLVRRQVDGWTLADRLMLHLRHLTSSSDNCESIRDVGLLGVRDVLSRDNELSSLFKQCGLIYDSETAKVTYRGATYAISDYKNVEHRPDRLGSIGCLLHVLATDSCVNSFIYSPCLKRYSVIAHYPEKVDRLEASIGADSHIDAWKSRLVPYVVEFTVSLDQLDASNLIPEEGDDHLFSPCEGHHCLTFNVLLYRAIQVVLGCCEEVYAFLPQGRLVNPDSIISILPLSEFCASKGSCDRGISGNLARNEGGTRCLLRHSLCGVK